MLRDLVDRFAYRYQLWSGEKQSEKVGAGEAPPDLSPRSEPWWRLVGRMLQVVLGGLFILGALYRFAMRTFPTLSDGIPMIFIFLAAVWVGVGLFITGGELLTKYSRRDDDDNASN